MKLTLISCSALLTAAASAQSVQAPRHPNAAPAVEDSAAASKTLTAGVTVKAPVRTPSAAATGQVIVLADGVVANARLPQILPPAPGFVYER